MPEVCPICYIKLECDHVFCDDCMRIYVTNKIDDNQ